MSFSLWPGSSGADRSANPVRSERTPFSTPALDFIKVLHSSKLRVLRYRNESKKEIFNRSTIVGSGAYSVVEASRTPGVVIKRTKYSQNSDLGHAPHAERNLVQLTSELRILMSEGMRSYNLFVKVLGVCYEESMSNEDPSGAGHFHLLLQHSKLGDMASFLRCNGQHLDTKSKFELIHHVASGLALLHLEQICHGDLKVQNVLIFNSENGGYVAKLADFGMSIYPEDRGINMLIYPSRVVRYSPGTLLLNAPEVRESNLNTQSVDIISIIRADIFSFGLLVWETIKNGESYFDAAWLDANGALNSEAGLEEQLALLSTLPHNGLLSRCEEFLLAQGLDNQRHQQILRVVRGSLQDEPLQRQPMSQVCEELYTLAENERTTYEASKDSVGSIPAWRMMDGGMEGGFETWNSSFTNPEVLEFTTLSLPDNLQRCALDEFKTCASSASPLDEFDKLRGNAALSVAECYLISFGTAFDSAEVLRWLRMAQSYGETEWICLDRISEALSSPLVFGGPKGRLLAIPEEAEVERCTRSELHLIEGIQSRVASAVKDIRALPSKGQSWMEVDHLELKADAELGSAIGHTWIKNMAISGVAALLGENQMVARLLHTTEVSVNCGQSFSAVHYACIGGNMSTLKLVLNQGVDPQLRGWNGITTLHLLIFMPADVVGEAVSLLIAHGAPTDNRSEATKLSETGLKLTGTPLEWAVMARHRALVAALLPHSKGQEVSALRLAISHAYYEIVADLLSNSAYSGPVSQDVCPTLVFCRPPFMHLSIHGRDGDAAIERTIRLCDKYSLISYENMLINCLHWARTRSCLKALEVLLELCPPSIIRYGFENDNIIEAGRSILYAALDDAKAGAAWRSVLEILLENFTLTELEEVKHVNGLSPSDDGFKANTLQMAVLSDWTVAARVLLEKGCDVNRKLSTENGCESCLNIAVTSGSIEMQAILSEYGGRCDGDGYIKRMLSRSRGRADLIGNVGDVDASKLDATHRAHVLLRLLLSARDIYFVAQNSSEYHQKQLNFNKYPLLKEFRALVSEEPIADNIDAPDEDGVTMLQRATAHLDIEIVRFLLEAGADANRPYLAKKVGGHENDPPIALLPFQIACWVSRTQAPRFESGSIRPLGESDASLVNPVGQDSTGRSRLLHRITHNVSHVVGTRAKRMMGLDVSTPGSRHASTPGSRHADLLWAASLRVAQELLRWHQLRDDRRFEGIAEYHICGFTWNVRRAITLLRQRVDENAKASWPGRQGKYTAVELAASPPFHDEYNAFRNSKLRGYGRKLL